MIVVCGGIKGGVGKTTVATNLAVMRQASSMTVVLVDADEQRSASEFAEQREALNRGRIPCVKASGKDTLSIVRDLAGQYDSVIVDVGGRDTTAQRAAMLAADIVLLPFPPGNYDAWTLPQVENLVSEVRKANPDLDAVAFLSRAYLSGPDNNEAAEMLKGSSVLRFVDAPLTDRKVFARSAGEGLAVFEIKDRRAGKARSEVMRLYDAVFNGGAELNTNAA